MSEPAPSTPAPGVVQLVTDRRLVVLGGGLLLGFTIASTKPYARGERVNPTGPQPVSSKKPSQAFGAAYSGHDPEALIHIAPQGDITLIMPNVECGQGIYTGEATLIAEELEVGLDQIQVAAAPPDEALYKQPLLQLQATGGSTSIRGAWTPFRQAGALARTLLVQAAAQAWGVPASECVARRAVITHAASGRSAPYGTFADAASRLPKPTGGPQAAQPVRADRQAHSAGRHPGQGRGAGQVWHRHQRPGMKIATVAASPVLGGRLASVDDTAALAMPGVRQVVQLPNAVAVVGDHFWAAKTGLDALKITWAPGANASLSTADLWASMDRSAREGPAAVAMTRGVPDQTIQRAQKRLTAIYRQPFLCHAPMEPQAAVVHVRGGGAEVWCGTQVPTRAQAVVAKIVGCPVEQVTLNNQLIGGAFGRKLETDYVEQATAIAKACPYPVKLVWTREEDMQHDNYRPMYLDVLSAGLDGAGHPAAWTHRITGASVTARWVPQGMRPNGVDPDAVEEAEDPVYGQFPNMRVEYVQWRPPPGVIVSWWRGVGPTHNIFVIESFVDELAHAAGKDPVAYRRELLANVPRARAVLERAAQAAAWGSPLPPRTGRGVIVQKSFGTYIAAVVEAQVADEGDVTLRRVTAVADPGYVVNPDVLEQQIEGGLIFGLAAALFQQITLKDGRVQQSNFNDYRTLRIDETPPIQVIVTPTDNPPGGIGEAGTTAAAPALTNAIFAATGVRLREVPVDRSLLRRGARGGVQTFAALAAAGIAAGALEALGSPQDDRS